MVAAASHALTPAPFACDVLVGYMDHASALAGQGVVHTEPSTTATAVLWQVQGLQVEEEVGVVAPLLSREDCAVKGM